jgi:hypothetical protein
MFLRKYKKELESILLSSESKEIKAMKLFDLRDYACASLFAKRWAESELHQAIKRFLKENSLSIGGLLDWQKAQ